MDEKRTVSLNRVRISKPVETDNKHIDFELYDKLTKVTNSWYVNYKYNPYGKYYNMFIYFSTCKDIYELMKIFGEDYDISLKNINERKL